MTVISLINSILLFVHIDIVLITYYILYIEIDQNNNKRIASLFKICFSRINEVIAHSGFNLYVYNILVGKNRNIIIHNDKQTSKLYKVLYKCRGLNKRWHGFTIREPRDKLTPFKIFTKAKESRIGQ